MPITKDGTNQIIYTAPDNAALFEQTGVAHGSNFAICDTRDVLKQIQFDPSAQTTNTTVTFASGANSSSIRLTLPSVTGTIATTASQASFTTIQCPVGTSPVATGPTDTLTLTSSDSTVTITGNSTTDTIDLKATGSISALTGDVTASGVGSVAATVAKIQGVAISGTPSTGQHLKAVSSTAALWENQSNLSTELGPLYEDFTGGFYGSGICGTSWTLHFQGTGAGTTQVANLTQSTATNPGVIELTTGTTSSGVSWIDDLASSQKNIYLGGGYTIFECILKLSNLSDGTDTLAVSAGIEVGTSGATSSDGIYFGYSHGTNSGNWVAYCSKSSANTVINSSVAASASAFQRLTWILNSAGTSVEFFINGVSLGSTVTNIPLSTTALRHFIAIVKSVGTTSRSLYVDAIGRYTRFATAR